MSNYVFANNATTTLGSTLPSSATSCTVATGTGSDFPVLGVGEFFSATLWAAGSGTGEPNEIVYVTDRSGDTMTLLRGQEGTIAQDWNVGDTFANYATAGFWNSLLQEGQLQQQSTNSGLDGGSVNAGAVALSPAPINMSALLFAPIRVLKEASNNSGAYTLNVNGIGAYPVTIGGNALVAGQLLASQVFEVIWDGTNFELISTPGAIANSGLEVMPPSTVKANMGSSPTEPSDVACVLLTSYTADTGGVNWVKTYSNGVIEQGGFRSGTYDHEASYTYLFNTPFPHAVHNVLIGAMSLASPSNGSDGWLQEVVSDRSLTGFGIQVQSTGSSWAVPGVGFEWFARGN